jgi:dipeptidase D
MENRKAIVMQGHLDMVHQKIQIQFLISTQGIDMYVDEDWVELEELHLEQIMV